MLLNSLLPKALRKYSRACTGILLAFSLVVLQPARSNAAVSLFPNLFEENGFSLAQSDAKTGAPLANKNAEQNWPFPERKDPFFAAALSWFVPGLGQLYVNRPLEGACYWLVNNALFWGAVLSVATLDIGLERDIGFRFAIRMRDNVSTARAWTAVGLGVFWLASHIYTVLAAANAANAHNEQILMREMQRDGFALELSPGMGGMSWSYAF